MCLTVLVLKPDDRTEFAANVFTLSYVAAGGVSGSLSILAARVLMGYDELQHDSSVPPAIASAGKQC